MHKASRAASSLAARYPTFETKGTEYQVYRELHAGPSGQCRFYCMPQVMLQNGAGNTRARWERRRQLLDRIAQEFADLFPCPDFVADQIRYTWAGRHDDTVVGRTDGFLRTAQIEAYAAADALAVDKRSEEGEGK